MPDKKLVQRFLVKPHTKVRLRDWDTAWADTEPLRKLKGDELKQEARETIHRNLEHLADAQELLFASDRHALLVVLQGMDASGKDGLLKHVMSGLNPQGCQVISFKQPSNEELEHDFLWRYTNALPPRGRIGIFNRSHYEDVLVVRVHPEWLDKQKLPSKRGHSLWAQRYEDINQFEEHLARNGTVILKFFLHVSKKEQKRRLLERLDNPAKHWKFSAADLAERAFWSDYVEAYEDALSSTSTRHAPWFIVPADHKWVARLLVSEILTRTIEGLDLKFPELTKPQRIALAKAKKLLASG
jgi:PPK2 family polyphosphate:nucleotide phosphotransferase